jgi:hypothetical protein
MFSYLENSRMSYIYERDVRSFFQLKKEIKANPHIFNGTQTWPTGPEQMSEFARYKYAGDEWVNFSTSCLMNVSDNLFCSPCF